MSNTNLKRTITEIEIAAAGVKSLTRCLNFLHDACLDRTDNDLAEVLSMLTNAAYKEAESLAKIAETLAAGDQAATA
jgi:hypothetical protein